jgi:phosphonate transport system substrate-binding protein
LNPRRAVTGALLCAIWFFSCARDEPPRGRSAPGEVRFSIPADAAHGAQSSWAPLLADMGGQTELKVTPFFSTDPRRLVEAMKAKQIDVGLFSNGAGLEAVRRADGQVFARTSGAGGPGGHASVLIVAARSRITLAEVLRCDRRLAFSMGDALSTSGTLAPMTYLFAPRGLDPASCFRQVRTGVSHLANLDAVAGGRVAVATSDTAFLDAARRSGRREAAMVRIVWRSPPMPEDPLIWRRDLDPAVKEKLRQFFLTYGAGDSPRSARQRADLEALEFEGFRAADENHLLPVREMEASAQWLAAKKTKDPARIAAATRRLDAIRADRLAFEARTRAPAAAQ